MRYEIKDSLSAAATSAGLILLAALTLFVVAAFAGCGGGGGDAGEHTVNDEVGAPDGVSRLDTDGDGLTDHLCQGANGGSIVITCDAGNCTNTGDAGDGGEVRCTQIDDGNNNTGQPDDNSSEETHEAPADG